MNATAPQPPNKSAGGAAPLSREIPGGSTKAEPILCNHCGRTASNGISCQGSCVADSGY